MLLHCLSEILAYIIVQIIFINYCITICTLKVFFFNNFFG